MASDVVWLSIEGKCATRALHEACKSLDGGQSEVVLDFASVQRIDSGALHALDELADTASSKGIRLVLNHVSVDIYKVLRLMGLASRFSFRA